MNGERSIRHHLKQRLALEGCRLAFRAADAREFTVWKNDLRGRISDFLGLTHMRRPTCHSVSGNMQDCGMYTQTEMELETEPGISMPLLVLKPKSAQGRCPAVVALHGHVSGGKLAVAGIRDIPKVSSTIDKYNYDYGRQFVREGFIVFCPDARGFGERREDPSGTDILGCSCTLINKIAIPLGQTVAGMWVWDIMRLVDYIVTREDCDPDRIACAGLSGGGLQTLYSSALDERIRCAVISGYFYGVAEAHIDVENCSCNYIPHMWEYADMGDVGALIAPRPLLIETGDRDEENGSSGLANVLRQVETTRQAYRLLGAEHLLFHDVFSGPHKWHGKHAVPWVKQHLGPVTS